jgi:hypothetical protein
MKERAIVHAAPQFPVIEANSGVIEQVSRAGSDGSSNLEPCEKQDQKLLEGLVYE